MAEVRPDTPILTNQQAVAWLRLDADYPEPVDAVRALHRLVREGKIRPLRCGKTYKFTVGELRRYAELETARFTPVRRGATDCRSDGKPA